MKTGASKLRLAFRSLRDGTWVDRPRTLRVCALLLVGYCASWAFVLAGPGLRDPIGRPIATDFAFLYAGSSAIRRGLAVALYSFQDARELVRDTTGSLLYAWFYPPAAFLLFYPLSLVPYLGSLALWVGGSIAAFVLAIRKITWGRQALLVVLAFPGVYVAASHGQSTILVSAALAAFLALLPDRPAISGALLAVVAVRPHVGLLIPLVLALSGRWIAFASGAAAVVLTSVVSTLAFGVAVWPAFFASLGLAGRALEGAIPFYKLCSVYGGVRLVGGSTAVAALAHALVAAVAVTVAAWLWWRRRTAYELSAAGLVVASLLVSPYLFDYDLAAMALFVAFFVRFAGRHHWRRWEKTVLAFAWASPLLARPLALTAHVPIAPIALCTALGVLVSRARSTNLVSRRMESAPPSGVVSP